MTEALRRSAKAHHAISVSCWPAAVYRLHDLDGKPTSDPDTTMMDNMARFGWKHGGFTVGYESVVNRWNFVKGLDGIHNEKELLARSPSTVVRTSASPRIPVCACADWNAAN